MYSRNLLVAQAVVLAALALLHYFALEFSLYWHFVWLDLASHTLGGIWAGLFALWLRPQSGFHEAATWVVFGAIVLGIGWEFFEITIGSPRAANFFFDTSLDLFADVVGGVIAAAAVHIVSFRKE